MNNYAEEVNPYKEWHMRQAFRRGWEAAEQGLDREQAQARVDESPRLNRMTTPAWWRGYDTCCNANVRTVSAGGERSP